MSSGLLRGSLLGGAAALVARRRAARTGCRTGCGLTQLDLLLRACAADGPAASAATSQIVAIL